MNLVLDPDLETILNEVAKQQGTSPETLALKTLREKFTEAQQPISTQNDSAQLGNPTMTIEQRFTTLAKRWEQETAALSSITQIAMNPAYQEIIGLGSEVVPLMLHALEERPQHWFWALRAITGEDPIKPEQRGRVGEMAAAWIEWGRAHGVIA